jgi:ceramide glucosyltransferase
MLLFPMRDLMGFGFWVASYGSNKILWRGEQYTLEKGGHMRSAHAAHTITEAEPGDRESALTT